jgi:hypothetical protein
MEAADNQTFPAPMTKERRKEIVLKYMKGLDRGRDVADLFAEDAEVFFPKWGIATDLIRYFVCLPI